MKFLSVAGTAAMFLVGGGILVHGLGPLHHAIETAGQAVAQGRWAGYGRRWQRMRSTHWPAWLPGRWCWRW